MKGWAALEATTDRRAHARNLARAHDRMVAGKPGAPDPLVRPVIGRSWARSAAAGVSPERIPAPRIAEAGEVERRWLEHPLSAAVPVIGDLLGDVGDEEHVATVCDADGTLLWVNGRDDLLAVAQESHILPGASWAESVMGTNGLGTSLAERHPVQIFSAEHYVSPVHRWTCTAAPVHDPLTGDLLGAINIAGSLRTAHPHSLAMVSLAARTVEQQLLRRAQVASRRRLAAPQAVLSVLGRDRGILRVGRNDIELSRRHTEMLLLLWLRPEGMTAEQLALEVYGEHGRPGSVRTEMHRLRVHLGELLGERPYRLVGALGCDLAGIEERVRSGDVSGALAEYRGPAVPGTEVPRLVEMRERIDDGLRAAAIATGDSELLEAWLRTPNGRDDYEASRTLIARLDRDDPRRAVERSRVRRLASTRPRD